MPDIAEIFANNRCWGEERLATDSTYVETLARDQNATAIFVKRSGATN